MKRTCQLQLLRHGALVLWSRKVSENLIQPKAFAPSSVHPLDNYESLIATLFDELWGVHRIHEREWKRD